MQIIRINKKNIKIKYTNWSFNELKSNTEVKIEYVPKIKKSENESNLIKYIWEVREYLKKFTLKNLIKWIIKIKNCKIIVWS